MPGRLPGGDGHRRLFTLRLGGMRVRDGGQQIIHPPLAGELIVPVHWDKQRAGALAFADRHFRHHHPMARPDPRQPAGDKLVANGVLRRHLHHRLRDMLHQPRHGAGAGHGVPLIADPPAVEDQRIKDIGCRPGRLRRHWHHPQPAIAMPAARNIPGGAAAADRPAYRRHSVPCLAAEIRQRADIKRPLAVVFETGQRRMLAEDVMRMLPGKRLAIPQRLPYSGDDPPVRFRLPRRRQEAALTGDAPLRVGDRAIFLAPGQRRKANVGELSGIRLSGDIRDDHQRTAGQRLAHRVAVGERHHRVGAHDPHRFHLAAADGGKQLHGGQPRGLRQPLGSPKAGQPLQIVWHKIHVRRQHRRQPADFAPAHGVGLTGQRKGAAAAAAILSAGQMDVDDGITFVAAAG